MSGKTTSAFNDDVYGYELDTAFIETPRGSSRIIWSGFAPTRRYITNLISPAVGQPTCIEGSQTQGSCGVVYDADYEAGDTMYLIAIQSGSNTITGDSGAPSWWASGFGPLAQGTLVGVLPGQPNVAYAQKINVALYWNGVSLNTVSSP